MLVRSGAYEEAAEAYTAIVRSGLHPQGVYPYRAIAYRRMKRLAEAVADYDRILVGATPGVSIWHRYQRATPLWMLGRAEEALEEYRRVRVALGRPFFSDARSYLILRELGRDEEAADLLQTALHEVEEEWLRQVFRTLAGELSEEALVAEAQAAGNAEQLCEAYYYAGECRRLNGRTAEARTYFQRCLQTGVEFDQDTGDLAIMNEYELAEWRLELLGDAAGTPTDR
jgi:tetratricopeptide (TPR) repeat protein